MFTEGDRVAVHYRFQGNNLSVRRIRKTGTLGAFLGAVNQICLRDAEFTFDKQRWQKWMNGNKHVRQFAEVRGFVDDVQVSGACSELVRYAPRLRPDFFLAASNYHISQAPIVLLKGKNIYVPKLEV